MQETQTIVLGAREFKVRPLTIGQLSTILPAFVRCNDIQAEGAVPAAVDIIEAALARDNPMKRDEIMNLEAKVPELIAATMTIAKMSGLVVKIAGDPAGEQKAGSP